MSGGWEREYAAAREFSGRKLHLASPRLLSSSSHLPSAPSPSLPPSTLLPPQPPPVPRIPLDAEGLAFSVAQSVHCSLVNDQQKQGSSVFISCFQP